MGMSRPDRAHGVESDGISAQPRSIPANVTPKVATTPIVFSSTYSRVPKAQPKGVPSQRHFPHSPGQKKRAKPPTKFRRFRTPVWARPQASRASRLGRFAHSQRSASTPSFTYLVEQPTVSRRFWRMPQVCNDMHTAVFYLCCLRILVLIDHVLIDLNPPLAVELQALPKLCRM